MMDDVDNDFDPDNDISYGKSNKGHEVMIVNERELFNNRIRTLSSIDDKSR